MSGNKAVVEKRFEYRGYPCVVIFQALGHRCGNTLYQNNNGIQPSMLWKDFQNGN